MRTRLYSKVKALIGEYVPEVRHVDLWNQNVQFIEQEEAWERPAVFVEFSPIDWRRLKAESGARYKGSGRLMLHVVTDWTGEDREMELGFAVADKVAAAMDHWDDGEWAMELSASHTNHNHEELVENIEEFAIRGYRR